MNRLISKYILLTLVFLCQWSGISKAQITANVADKIIAKIDNYIILKSDLEGAYAELLSQGKVQEGGKCEILEQLVINKLMLAKAEIDSVIVEDDLVEDQLNRRMDQMLQQVEEEDIVKAYNKTIAQIKDELRDQIKEQMITQKMQETIVEKVKITPKEVIDFFNAIPKDSVPLLPAEVEVAQIVRVHEVNKEQKKAIKAKMLDIKSQILGGADFAALAKKHSEDGSANKGGELGWHKRGELVPEYEAAIFRLKEGDISDPIESQFGFHLIQLIERRGNEYNSKHILLRPTSTGLDKKATEQFLDSIRVLIVKDSISFIDAAKEYSSDKETKDNGGFILSYDRTTKVPLDKNFDSYLYQTLDTMKVGTISKVMPFRGEDGKEAMRILYFKSKIPIHVANLKDDYAKIQNFALNAKKNMAINEWFLKSRKEVFIKIDEEYKNCKILGASQ